MNFIDKLNIFKRLEYGNLSIGKLSVLGSILILLTNDLLYPLITKIVIKTIFLFTPTMHFSAHNFIVFCIQFICAITSLAIIYYLLKLYHSLSSYNINTSIPCSNIYSGDLYYCALLIIGFRIFYASSISHITNLIPLPHFIEESFRILSSDYTYLFLSVCIFAPCIEEFMYRGILLNGFLKKYSDTAAIIFSSLIFGIVHFNIPQGINAFLLGIILGYIYTKTHSIYICIFMHFINNLCAQFISLNNFNIIFILFQSILFFIIGLVLIIYSFSKLNLTNRD